MNELVTMLDDVSGDDVAQVGGKAAVLGELRRLGTVSVPDGFCVTTLAFRRAIADLDLTGDPTTDRARIERAPVPSDVAEVIADAVAQAGDDDGWAVRSSATTEDRPGASAAGQHDSVLDVHGLEGILDAVRRCWASAFSDRAVAYRARGEGTDEPVAMAVLVQRMVDATASGVAFTADPRSGDRRTTTIEAIVGLGDALVSGRVTPDAWAVRDGAIVERRLAAASPVLSDAQVHELVTVARDIAVTLGRPQDIEWCWADYHVEIVQSRPITTLFPVPLVGDDRLHVYVSVGHQQMMTDAMTPLGLSLWKLTAARPMDDAGGRLFVDITDVLAQPAMRAAYLGALERSDPLIGDALDTLLRRRDVGASPATEGTPAAPAGLAAAPPPPADPSIVAELIAAGRAGTDTVTATLAGCTGPAVFDAILADLDALKAYLFNSTCVSAVMAGMNATSWLNDHLLEWLGEPNAADTLTLSAPGNITSEMGLALLAVADVVRDHPAVVPVLAAMGPDDSLDPLDAVDGGPTVRAAIDDFLDRYGARGPGEIDITRPRWNERPAALAPLILGSLRTNDPGAGRRRFEHGEAVAQAKAEEVVARLAQGPNGDARAAEAAAMIAQLRTFVGFREFPKFVIVERYWRYKQALLVEVDRLVDAGVLATVDDAWFLTFDELRGAVATGTVDHAVVAARRADHALHRTLRAPRVLTSDGEGFDGQHRRGDVAADAIVGLPVSSGVIDGRVRIAHDPTIADLQPGDILVTTCTDPSWTPLFVAVSGLITEVGGLMTHGAVIAREYGLPAIVGVTDATTKLHDGQRIRLDGTTGVIEPLNPGPSTTPDHS